MDACVQKMREDELTIHMMSEEQLGTVTEGEDTADRMSVNFPGGTLEERNGFARPLLSSTFISGPTAYDTVEMISVGEEKVEIEMERGEKPIAMGDGEQFEEDSLVPGYELYPYLWDTLFFPLKEGIH